MIAISQCYKNKATPARGGGRAAAEHDRAGLARGVGHCSRVTLPYVGHGALACCDVAEASP